MTDSQPLTIDVLKQAVAGSAAALRCRNRLQPAGGPGTKVFPPTYAGAVYAVEQRRLPGRDEPVTCVLLDSVQSQANRMEEALQDALDREQIRIPVVVVDFSPYYHADNRPKDEELRLLDPIGRVTSLQAPHRLADAILRDSLYDGQPFRKSDLGREIDRANVQNATPLYRLCPTALVFGMWDSTGPKGGLGAKFERALVSEIVGVGCCYRYDGTDQPPKNMGIRRDPLSISSAVPLKKTQNGWELLGDTTYRLEKGAVVADTPEGTKKVGDAKKLGAIKPSEVNHSNVIFPGSGAITATTYNAGITIEYAEQTTVLSLPVLRRLRFPADGNWQPSPQQQARDAAAQTVLAALSLCAVELAAAKGLDLRSRCLLWPDEPRRWELLDKPGTEPACYHLDADAARELLAEAIDQARNVDLTWHDDPITLTPAEKLVELVCRSQELMAKQTDSAEAD